MIFVAKENDAPWFNMLCQWISTNTGIDCPEDKKDVLHQKLSDLCESLKIEDFQTLHNHLQWGTMPNLNLKVAATVSTNHTFFFREREVLNFFENTVLPSLPCDEQVRLWSAASSSGEEAALQSLTCSSQGKLGSTVFSKKLRTSLSRKKKV